VGGWEVYKILYGFDHHSQVVHAGEAIKQQFFGFEQVVQVSPGEVATCWAITIFGNRLCV
jgi:hypothetical protein